MNLKQHPPKVSLFEKTALGCGALAGFYGYAGVSILAYPFFNMILGVNAAWVGFALMIPRVWDAVSDPLMGKISDNFESKWGRRRPFILIGAIAMGLLFSSLWIAPTDWSNNQRMTLFIGLHILYFTTYTVFSVPYTALSYEMTPDYHERTSVMAFIAFFHKLGELSSGWILPIAFSLGNAMVSFSSGDIDSDLLGITALGLAIGFLVLMVFGSLPALFVRERHHTILQKMPTKVDFWLSVKSAFKSGPFLILVAVVVFNTLSGVLASGIDQYLLVYYMNGGYTEAGLLQKGLLTTGYGLMGFISIPLITLIAKRLSKKGSLYLVYSLMVIGGLAKWVIFTPGHHIFNLDLFFFTLKVDPIILIDPLLCGPMWVAVKIMLASMMADICDEDELKCGQRREGMFGAMFSWIEKMVVSLSYMGTGIALSASGFQPELGGAQSQATFTSMRLFLCGAPTITALAAILALWFYPIDAQRAKATRATLDQRHETGDPQ
jgi:GPH family glycoside/pentoside/hexuronide:cation symporter